MQQKLGKDILMGGVTMPDVLELLLLTITMSNFTNDYQMWNWTPPSLF